MPPKCHQIASRFPFLNGTRAVFGIYVLARRILGNWRRPPTRGGSCCGAVVLRDAKRLGPPAMSNGLQRLGPPQEQRATTRCFFAKPCHANAALHDRRLIIRAGDIELNPGPLCILQWNCQDLRAKKEELTSKATREFWDAINRSSYSVHLHWIPSHCDMEGNELAHQDDGSGES